jgi:Mrp family chromosome partitioning ATPase
VSRNFEILQRAGKVRGLFAAEPAVLPPYNPRPAPNAPSEPSKSIPPGRRLQLSLEGAGREEAIRLVQRVFLAQRGDGPRTVVFSGVERGVGCTWNCAWAARALAAHVSGRVCVVDANLRHPALHREFGLGNSVGLVGALSENGSAVSYASQLGDTNLWVLPSGTEGSDLSRVCTPMEMDLRLSELESQFEFVLIDSPALDLYADALALGQMTDGLVLVLESSSTQRFAARRAKQNADAHRVRVFGAVLNRFSQKVPDLVSRILK